MLDAPEVWRPTRHTTLTVEASPIRIEDSQEVLDLHLKNTGPMTALFCEPHPLITYRTDLFIENNHCFIPPGESRTITIRASKKAASGLSLEETGWRIGSWNTDDLTIAPRETVLLAVGRQDQMCREFLGYLELGKIANAKLTTLTTLTGARPDSSQLPYRLESGGRARFEFAIQHLTPNRAARLRIHTADQSKDTRAVIVATVNGKPFEQSLPEGLGIQAAQPDHLAFPATAEFAIPSGVLQPGQNIVQIQLKNEGWFTWDAIDLTESEPTSTAAPSERDRK